MAKENSGPGFLSGLLLGGLIGVVLGLLYAPQAGEKTREQLQSRFDEFSSLGKSAWEEGKEAAGQKSAELRARFEQTRGKFD